MLRKVLAVQIFKRIIGSTKNTLHHCAEHLECQRVLLITILYLVDRALRGNCVLFTRDQFPRSFRILSSTIINGYINDTICISLQLAYQIVVGSGFVVGCQRQQWTSSTRASSLVAIATGCCQVARPRVAVART